MATRIASIAVVGLKTAARHVSHMVVECYSNSSLSTLVGQATSPVQWDGSFNVQKEYIQFSGLTLGATYWMRCGVVAPYGLITWSSVYSLVAGSTTGPNPTYAGTAIATTSGVSYDLILSNVPADIDHYEAIWTKNGTTPANDAKPMWTGPSVSNHIQFFAGGKPGETVTAFVRAINTAHIPQKPWKQLDVVTITSATTFQNIDDIPDGSTYGKVRLDVLTGGRVDPRRTGFIKLGSVNPAWSGVLYYETGTSAATGGSYVKWWWDQIIVRRIDGTNTVIGSLPYSSSFLTQNSGLNSSSTYYFYPRWEEFSQQVTFVTGGVGSKGNAWTFRSDEAARYQNFQDCLALSQGAIAVTTPAYSGGTTGGTGGGGGSGCPRATMLVEARDRGLVPIGSVQAGEYIRTCPRLGHGEWVRVKDNTLEKAMEFINIKLPNGAEVEQDPSSIMMLEDAPDTKLKDITLNAIVKVAGQKVSRLLAIEVVSEQDYKAVIQCEEPHAFLCGKDRADILVHNIGASVK